MGKDKSSAALVIAILAMSGLVLATSACGTQAPAKPTLEILSPPSGSEVAVGEEIQVQYRATDPVAVVRVELEVEGQIVDSQNSPVAEGQPSLTGILRWTPDAPGTHSLVAYAYNRDRVASAPVGVDIFVVEEAAPGPTATPTGAASPTTTPTPALSPTSTPSPTPTQTPVPEPSFGPITFAPGVTEGKDFEPINPGTVFPAGTEQIYCIFEYQGMKTGMGIQGKIYHEGEEIGYPPDTWHHAESGTMWWRYPTALPGNYRVELYIEGQLVQTGTFVIGEAGGLSIGPFSFSMAVDENNNCLNPTTTFSSGTTRIYTCWQYAGLLGKTLRIVWLRDGQTIKEVTSGWDKAEGNGFWWWQPQGGYTPGNYEVQLYVEGQLMRSGNFIVQ